MNSSTKKLFTYISLTLVIGYFVFVLWMYNSHQLTDLYDPSKTSFYYIFVYILLVAVGYMIDIQTRKEPAFISLFAVPAFSLFLLLGLFAMCGLNWPYFIILCLIIILLYILGFFCYKRWISKILTIKNGYENILFGCVILHILVVLLVAFNVIGLL